MARNAQHVDNLVLGGGLTGCTTAWILSRQGYNGIVLEKSPSLGGINNSFRDKLENIFDFGEHSLEYGRSAFTTNFFNAILGDQVRKFKFKRGLLMEKELAPHASQVDEWPEKFQDKIEIDTSASSLTIGSPKEDFEAAYGSWFADLLFNEIISSYPDLKWKRKKGVADQKLLSRIFPWFCPLTDLEGHPGKESKESLNQQKIQDYHYRVRHGDIVEKHLYPQNNGFGCWIDRMVDQAKPELDFRLGQNDISFSFGDSELRLESVKSKGVRYTFDNVYWCIPIPILFKIKNWGLPEGKAKTYLIGSFTFENDFESNYHEILCGDPDIPVRKISFPEKIQGKDCLRTLQIEHMTLQENNQHSDQEWKNKWLKGIRQAGIIGQKNEIIDFELKKRRQGVVTTPSDGSINEIFNDKIKTHDTNLIFPCVVDGPTNINTIIPNIFNNMFSELTRY